jgi:hypothetical protein
MFCKNFFSVFTVVVVSIVVFTNCLSDSDKKYYVPVIESGNDYKVCNTGKYTVFTACGVEVFATVGIENDTVRIEADPELLNDIEVINKAGLLTIIDRHNYAEKLNKPKAKVYIQLNDSSLYEVYVTAANMYVEHPLKASQNIISGTITVDSTVVATKR